MVTLTSDFFSDLIRLQAQDTFRVVVALAKLDRDFRHPSLQVKKMEGCELYEVRASQELRIVAERFNDDMVCRIVDHHDAALRRALRIPLGLEPSNQTVRQQSKTAGREILLTTGASRALPHLSDAQLMEDFAVPLEWLATVRRFNSEQALLDSGIDEAIGVEHALSLAAEYSEEAVQRHKISVVRSDLLLRGIRNIASAEFIQQVVIATPYLTAPSEAQEFAGFIDLVRTKRFQTIVVTRTTNSTEHRQALRMLSRIPTVELLINEDVFVQVIACLAPSPWGFGAFGSGGMQSAARDKIGIVIPSRYGDASTIKQLASVVLDDLRTSLRTEKYDANRHATVQNP
jgi:hypothetical protein